MKNRIIALVVGSILLLFCANLLAQGPSILWVKDYDIGRCYSFKPTHDNGYIIVGENSYGNTDCLLVKTDSLGDTLWLRRYGGTNFDCGYDVQVTSDSGFIITGHYKKSAANPDLYLIRTDLNGDTLWTKTYGGSGGEVGASVKQTSDRGYIIAGNTSSYGVGYDDAWIIKTNENGDTMWTKLFGGAGFDNANFIEKTSDGGYIVTGRYNWWYGAPATYEMFLLKVDSLGNTQWFKTYGSPYRVKGNCVRQTSDNGYIVVCGKGYYGDKGIFLIRTDSLGDSLWARTYGEGQDAGARRLIQTFDDGFSIIGTKGRDIWLIKTDSLGDTTWTQTYNVLSKGCSSTDVIQNSDSSYSLLGKYKWTYYWHTLLIKTSKFSLTSPVGGEILYWTTTHKITWYCDKFHSMPHSFILLLSSDSSASYSDTIATGISQDSTTWQWIVPQIFSTTCKVKVQALDSLNTLLEEDESDSNFTITLVNLTAPNGNWVYVWDQPCTITWQKGVYLAVPYYFNILFSTDSGQTYPDTIAMNVSSDSTTWDWTIPHVISSSCKVKIQAYDTLLNLLSEDESDDVFTIVETGIEEIKTPLKSRRLLLQVYPCPFANKISIEYSPENITQDSKIKIYDLSGRLIKHLPLILYQSIIVWDGTNNKGNSVPPGIYFLKLTTGEYTETKKLIKIR